MSSKSQDNIAVDQVDINKLKITAKDVFPLKIYEGNYFGKAIDNFDYEP